MRGTISSMVAANSPMAIGTTMKMPVQIRLLPSAVQNTGSAMSRLKFSSPMNEGVPMPSQRKKASAMVSTAGMRMMTALMSSVGTR